MSADNWTICPKCCEGPEPQRAEDDVSKLYGTIPMADFLDKMAEAKSADAMIADQEPTLREDYEIGIWKGRFSVNYSASCSKCGFEYRFTTEGPVPT